MKDPKFFDHPIIFFGLRRGQIFWTNFLLGGWVGEGPSLTDLILERLLNIFKDNSIIYPSLTMFEISDATEWSSI